jgi:hypothetical protein
MSSLTILVKNLPPQVTEDDIRRFFDDRIPRSSSSKNKNASVVSKVGHIYQAAADPTSRRALVTFTSQKKVSDAMGLKNRELTADTRGTNNDGKALLSFDQDMHELIILYEAQTDEVPFQSAANLE